MGCFPKSRRAEIEGVVILQCNHVEAAQQIEEVRPGGETGAMPFSAKAGLADRSFKIHHMDSVSNQKRFQCFPYRRSSILDSELPDTAREEKVPIEPEPLGGSKMRGKGEEQA
jgi:hypothetical protein